jgi:hypothetical protein
MFITPPPSPKITLQAPTPGPASRALSNQNAVVDATIDNLLDDRKAVFYVLGFFTCFILWVLGFIYAFANFALVSVASASAVKP